MSQSKIYIDGKTKFADLFFVAELLMMEAGGDGDCAIVSKFWKQLAISYDLVRKGRFKEFDMVEGNTHIVFCQDQEGIAFLPDDKLTQLNYNIIYYGDQA